MRIKGLEKFEGKLCKIQTNHVLYGKQKIEAIIDVINDADKLGVRIKSQEIFLFNNEIKDVKISNEQITIIGDIMEIKITVI